jgi:sugar-specific transcriptional regulator TrmB
MIFKKKRMVSPTTAKVLLALKLHIQPQERRVLAVKDEDIETLNGLGLSSLQARIYLILCQMGKATVKAVSNTAKIDRSDTYRVILKLHQLGLLKQIIGSPTIYESIPIREGIAILLKRKTLEYDRIRKKTENLVKHFSREPENQQEEENQFVLLPIRESVFKMGQEFVDKTQRTIELITTGKRLVQAWEHDPMQFDRAIDRGVRMRVILGEPKEEAQVLKAFQESQKQGRCVIRNAAAPLKASVVIYDGKEILFTTNFKQELNMAESRWLWSNSAALVAMAQDHFETKWSQSADFRLKSPRSRFGGNLHVPLASLKA